MTKTLGKLTSHPALMSLYVNCESSLTVVYKWTVFACHFCVH